MRLLPLSPSICIAGLTKQFVAYKPLLLRGCRQVSANHSVEILARGGAHQARMYIYPSIHRIICFPDYDCTAHPFANLIFIFFFSPISDSLSLH